MLPHIRQHSIHRNPNICMPDCSHLSTSYLRSNTKDRLQLDVGISEIMTRSSKTIPIFLPRQLAHIYIPSLVIHSERVDGKIARATFDNIITKTTGPSRIVRFDRHTANIDASGIHITVSVHLSALFSTASSCDWHICKFC